MKEHQVGELRDIVIGYASFLSSGSQLGTVLFSLSSLAVSWDTFGCHGWGLLLTRDAAGRPTVLKAALHSGNTWPQTSVVPR